MVQKTQGVELKTARDILALLNTHYPPPANGIPSKKLSGTNVVPFNATVDPYFIIYKKHNLWCLCCTDYYVYQQAAEYMQMCCVLLHQLQCKAVPCYIHVVQSGMLKKDSQTQKFIYMGTCSWT